MLKLVIFDHDGLMVNSEEIVFEAYRTIFARYGKDFTWEYYSSHIGMPVIDSVRLYLQDCPIDLSFEDFYTERNALVQKSIDESLEPMPGLLALIDYLKSIHMPMAVATSGHRDYLMRNLAKLKITSYFDTIVCIDDVERGKPDPALFLKTLQLAGVEPHEAIILEDSPHGIEAARRAGVFSIAIPAKGTNYNLFKHASLIADNLGVVQTVLESLRIANAVKADIM